MSFTKVIILVECLRIYWIHKLYFELPKFHGNDIDWVFNKYGNEILNWHDLTCNKEKSTEYLDMEKLVVIQSMDMRYIPWVPSHKSLHFWYPSLHQPRTWDIYQLSISGTHLSISWDNLSLCDKVDTGNGWRVLGNSLTMLEKVQPCQYINRKPCQ